MKIDLKIAKPSTRTYTVKGSTLEEVFEALNGNGFWGYYDPKHSVKIKSKNGSVTLVTVTANPRIDMPKWADYGKATKDERKSWDKMWKALESHESEHHDIYVTEAKAFKKRLEKIGEIDESGAGDAWDSFDSETREKQEKHDSKTDHGAKTGVVLEF